MSIRHALNMFGLLCAAALGWVSLAAGHASGHATSVAWLDLQSADLIPDTLGEAIVLVILLVLELVLQLASLILRA